MTDKVRLADPAMGDAELAAIREVFDSRSLTLGPMLGRFEQLIAGICDVPESVGVANGTAALHLALLALGVGPGDEVVVPAYTFPATSNAVRHVGATPVFCDVQAGLDVTNAGLVERKLSERTKAIMVVHLFGYPVDMASVMDLANSRGIPVIEDAAGALGALIDGNPAGSIGALGCFSFHPRKVVTCGEGGAVTGTDLELLATVRRLRHHGIGPNGFVDVGLNYRLSDILAAVAVPQLTRFAATLDEHERLARRYDDGLRAIEGIAPAPNDDRPGYRHGRQAYVARVDDPAVRDLVLDEIRSRDVETQVGTYCVPGIPPYRALGYDPADTPNAVDAAARGVALPLYPSLGDSGVDRVLEVVEASSRTVLATA